MFLVFNGCGRVVLKCKTSNQLRTKLAAIQRLGFCTDHLQIFGFGQLMNGLDFERHTGGKTPRPKPYDSGEIVFELETENDVFDPKKPW
jgi:hypothetical protein